MNRHGAKVHPSRPPWLEPSAPFHMTEPALWIAKKSDRYLRRPQPHVDRTQDHLGRVFPTLRSHVHALKCFAGDAAHTAVYIAEVTSKHHIQDERRDRSAEIAMQRRHGTWLDAPLESRTHHEFG